MKFSIIIPAYKCSDKISIALKSLSSQTYKNFEVVIVDDCSPDNTVAVAKNMLMRYKLDGQIITSAQNGGPGMARNIGIKNAKGEYICFMDADDYISDDYFETLNTIIVRKSSDLIYFGMYQVIGDKKREFPSPKYPDQDSFIAFSNGSLCRFCLKRDIILKYPLPLIKNAEDIAIIPLLILSAKQIEYFNKPLYYYIHNNSSLSSIYKPDVAYNFIKSFDYTLSFIDLPHSSGIEFHGIKTILYGAILNGIKAKLSKTELIGIINGFELKFPQWSQNKFLQAYSLRKRLFLSLVKGRHFTTLKMYVRMHSILLKYL